MATQIYVKPSIETKHFLQRSLIRPFFSVAVKIINTESVNILIFGMALWTGDVGS
jgi:hypothetical protein